MVLEQMHPRVTYGVSRRFMIFIRIHLEQWVKTKWGWDFPAKMWNWKEKRYTEHPFHSESLTHQIARCMKKGKSFGDGTPAAEIPKKWDTLEFAAHLCQLAAHAPPGTFVDDNNILASYRFMNARLKEVVEMEALEAPDCHRSRDSFNCRLIEWCEQIHYNTPRRDDLVLLRVVLEGIFYRMRLHFMQLDDRGYPSDSSDDEEPDLSLWANISDMRKRRFVGQPLYDRLWRFVQKANDAVHASIGGYPDDAEVRGFIDAEVRGFYGGSEGFDFSEFLASLSKSLADCAKITGKKAEVCDLLKFKYGHREYDEADAYRLSHGHEKPVEPKKVRHPDSWMGDDYMQFLMKEGYLKSHEIEKHISQREDVVWTEREEADGSWYVSVCVAGVRNSSPLSSTSTVVGVAVASEKRAAREAAAQDWCANLV